jgi:hypothetical protein
MPVLFLDLPFFSQLVGSGSMDCGKDIQSYIRMQIWFTQLVLVTTGRIGFTLRFPGPVLGILIICITRLKTIVPTSF